MEKVPGVKLSHFWDDMHAKKKSQIVTQLVMFDKALASNPFPEYGSLYCAEDGPRDDNFVIGPTTNRRYFDDGRGTLTLDRGPCKYTTSGT
ncbi:hypothetical protein BDV34DRAFT_195889 [Aspergillus parasiticus]|uniref:Uncharacterized protein n=1 Tax=Aspergillus parasiticus TaxID=5067 RepID=A0A5N6DLN0_ASPPA|nr:hypothetical protein BDV34DRAFT_195889 [Aspergillus parasiticus]